MEKKKVVMGEPFHVRFPPDIEIEIKRIASERYMGPNATMRCLVAERINQMKKKKTTKQG